jgi:hypothetical protein
VRRHPPFESPKRNPISAPPRILFPERIPAGEGFIGHKAQHGDPTDVGAGRVVAIRRIDGDATNGQVLADSGSAPPQLRLAEGWISGDDIAPPEKGICSLRDCAFLAGSDVA